MNKIFANLFKIRSIIILTFCIFYSLAEAQYCPTDSTIFVSWTFPSQDSVSILRFRNNGMRLEQACLYAPGFTIAVDGTPGHVYATNAESVEYFSDDWGETWEIGPNIPGTYLSDRTLRSGLQPDQCSIMIMPYLTDHYQVYYITDDSWQTYDSVLVDTMAPDGSGEEIGVHSLSFQSGILYGTY